MKHIQLIYSLTILFFSFISSSVFWDGSDSVDHLVPFPAELQSGSVTPAAGDTVEVKSEGADLSYDVTNINAKAGSELTIKYENSSDMPHNIVLVKTQSDIQPVGIAALQASSNDYIPPGKEDRIIAYTRLALPGETVYVTFTVPEPGSYPYICTYAGHFTMMQGTLNSTE